METQVSDGRGNSTSESGGASNGRAGTAEAHALVDVALARSFLYRFLATAYEDPTEESWSSLTNDEMQHAARTAALLVAQGVPRLAEFVDHLMGRLRPDAFEEHLSAYLACFGHAARGSCPLNEIEYGDIKADPLFQPHRLADLAAFYRAFDMAVSEDAHERQDHICVECEFMCVLAAKEAYALERQLGSELLDVCRDAQSKFLREHLGRWTPAFARRLEVAAGAASLGALARMTGAFIALECARFGVAPGSEDLLLRPVDREAETLCSSCGVKPESCA